MSAKVKITKRDIKEDKFTNTMLLAKEWLMERWQVVAIVAAIAVVAIVAVTYFVNLQEAKKYTGADLLNASLLKVRQQNYPEAINELQMIVNDYGGSVAARAQFYLANAYYESRNFDEAIIQFEKYISSYHLDKLTTASAIAGVGSCMENKQEFGPAGDKYLEAIEYYAGTPMAPDYYLGAVRCYSLGGDKEKAERTLAIIEEDYPNTKYSKSAVQIFMGVAN